MMQLRWLPALVLAFAAGLTGCAHKQQQVPCGNCPPGAVPPGALPPGALPPGARVLPAPPPGAALPGNPGPPGGAFVPDGGDPNRQPFPANPTTRPPVAQGQVRLPDNLFAPGSVQQSTWRPDDGTPNVRLGAPTQAEPPLADAAPAQRKEAPAQTPAPIDVPGFAVVRPGVVIGQEPFIDGVTWLQAQGYRTVLHVRPPDALDTAAQRVFENRRFRYISLQVAPGAITREAVEAFNRLVADSAAQPLFVFDHDGALAPGMFYLHFRTAGGRTHEQALAEAARLGFHPDSDPAHRAFLQGATAYLNGQ